MNGDAPDEAHAHRQLVAARRFAHEVRARSWWCLFSTLAALVAALCVAGWAPFWPVRLGASVTAGLVMGRAFILYHDYLHGAILRRSRLAKALMFAYGVLALAPPRSWRKSHNDHHAHVGKIEYSRVGSFWIMTTGQWRAASTMTRLHYRVVRSGVTILLGYVTVFLWAVTFAPLWRNPAQHGDSAIALALHAAIIAWLWVVGGPVLVAFVVVIPLGTAGALGAYLFYVQHNFVGMRVLSERDWSLQHAALESCSYLRVGPLMAWFTGNIGYHHVHHVNAAIPFYRLPEAMRAIPELQDPIVTTLRPSDVLACLRLKLWDDAKGRMVGYRDAASTSVPATGAIANALAR